MILKIFKRKPKLNLYESLSDLWLDNWNKMHEKNDLNWLRVDYDGRQKKIHSEQLVLLKKKLQDEYFLIWDDDKFKDTLKRQDEINYYIGLYDTVASIISRMRKGFTNKQVESRLKFIKQLKQLRYAMPEINTPEGEWEALNKIEIQNEGIKTKIKLLADGLEVDNQKVTRRQNTQLTNVSKTLELGYQLNAKTITVADWIDLQKEAIEVISKRKRTEE